MSSLLEKNLKLVFLPLPHPRPDHLDLYRKAAACWEEVWLHLFDEFKVEQPLFLDNFLRQDEAACLFAQNRCLGMILFRTVDFDMMNYRRDSYFKEWSEKDLANLLLKGKKAFLATFMTVHPDYRHSSPELNVKLKELFMEIMIRRFKESDADVISGIARRDRGMHDESYKMGAHVIRENVDYMGGRFKVDLVGFYRDAAKQSPVERVRAIVDNLWKERLEVGEPKNTTTKAA
jgi:hypothetical protein